MSTAAGRTVCVLSALLMMGVSSSFAAAVPADAGSKNSARQVDSGTTVVGDQDAAVGLFLTPWKNEAAADMDRAPGLLDREAATGDSQSLNRRIANEDALAAYRRSRLENR